MKRDKVKRNVVLEKSAYSGTYETFYRQWLDNIEKKDYLELDILKPQINETLRIWKNFSRKIYLVTMRNNRSNLLWQLQKINIYQLLDSVISCDPLQTCTKYEALREIPFSSAIFIGDTEEDTSTAKKLCIKSIAVTNGLRKREHLEADYYVEEICNIQLESIIEQILGSKLK
jgi:phosphoglycolate phosphatase-like HAD superfamily hydrolase